MPSRRVPVDLNAGTYFVTLTVQRWYYLFDRHDRWPILADSIRYGQERKGLELNGYVFMLNHIHLIVTSPDVAGFLRDFRRFTLLDGSEEWSWPTWRPRRRTMTTWRATCARSPMSS